MNSKKIEHNLIRCKYFLKWLLFSIAVGITVGFVGIAFHFVLEFANDFRNKHQWLILLLPVAGLLIIGLYKLSKKSDDRGTNFILISIRNDGKISLITTPLIFISTAVTHLFGGSAGREGAALQIGASMADKLARTMKIHSKDKKIITMCGMAAAFSAVFGTPVSATIFSMEVISVGVMYYAAIVPCIVASSIAFMLAQAFGVHSLATELLNIPLVNPADTIRVAILGILCAAVAFVFCRALKGTASLYSKYLSNPFVRVAVGGILIVLLTAAVGNTDYNGAGTGVILKALDGQADYYSFLLKILFTAITLGAGYRGGEIIPTFFIGATFGCAIGSIIGLDPSFAAALGMVGVFCGVTNCPMTSMMISIELFGGQGIVYFAIMSALCYMLSGYTGLYSEQKIVYSKFRPKFIDKKLN